MQEVTKTIVEISQVLKNVCTGVSIEQSCTFADCNECRAKALYNAGYRKVKQGEWQIRKSVVEADLFCSNCGYQYTEAEPSQIELYNYCPNCGAHMKGAE